jgi:serine/threonine protein phosphatase PrpC
MSPPIDAVVGGSDSEVARVRFGSVRGHAHRYYGEPRQDAIRVVCSPTDDVTVVAIADGVGTAHLSAQGAGFVVEEACRLMIEEVGAVADWWSILFSRLSMGLTELARALNCSSTDLATTLAVALLREEGTTTIADIAYVGDAVVLVLPETDLPDESDILSTETAAMPLNFDRVTCESFHVAPGETFLMATDGFAHLAFRGPGRAMVQESWNLDLPQSLGRFLWDMDVVAKTFDDDRTVFVYQRKRRD